MQKTLIREELIKAQNAFNCNIWIDTIQEILDSTNENEILIEDKYLDLIKEKATWGQILFCKALNLDLKMNIPKEVKEFVLEKIKACEVDKEDEYRTYYQENRRTLFVLNSETKVIWFDYDEIEQVLKEKYFLKYNEVREIINIILKEHLKLEDYTCDVL